MGGYGFRFGVIYCIAMLHSSTAYATDERFAAIPDQYIISATTSAPEAAEAELKKTAGLKILDRVPNRSIFLVEFAQSATDIRKALSGTLDVDGTVLVVPNTAVEMFSNQHGVHGLEKQPWSFQNPGVGGTEAARFDADLDGEEAIGRLRRTASTLPIPPRQSVVMVIDGGIDLTHPALASTVWTNPDEIAGNGKDDDGDGYVDDVNGWNFRDNNGLLVDDAPGNARGHGTHVAGIIAGFDWKRGNITGIAPYSRVLMAKMPVTSDNKSEIFSNLKAIYLGIAKRVDVISMSFGTTYDPVFAKATEEAWRSGIILVAAAGNSSQDVDQIPVYPCLNPGVICVMATNDRDSRASFSNYATRHLLVAAPGDAIMSTLPGGTFGPKSGTSMATPYVAGMLATIRSLYPSMPPGEVLGRLINTSDKPYPLQDGGFQKMRVNAYRAYFAPIGTYGPDDGYCDERIPDQQSGGSQSYPRWNNSPYANSGEKGIDGLSPKTAFTICTPKQLIGMNQVDLDKVFVLRRHLDWSTLPVAERKQVGAYISSSGTRIIPFSGILDGNGFAIRSYTAKGAGWGGLIGEIGPGGLLVNLRFIDAEVSTQGIAGVLADKSRGRIANAHVEGVVQGASMVGGLVGQQFGGSISSSFFEGRVAGVTFVGGLAGTMQSTTEMKGTHVDRSYFQGQVVGSIAGGIAGLAQASTIRQSYAVTYSSGTGTMIGGLVGQLRCRGKIENSYAEGRISGKSALGGLVGDQTDADIAFSYSSLFVSGSTAFGGSVGSRRDGLTNSIDSTPPLFLCSGTTNRPPPSTFKEVFFNSTLTIGAGGFGVGRSQVELANERNFDTWSRDSWIFGGMPALKDLPRSTSANY